MAMKTVNAAEPGCPPGKAFPELGEARQAMAVADAMLNSIMWLAEHLIEAGRDGEDIAYLEAIGACAEKAKAKLDRAWLPYSLDEALETVKVGA